MTFELSRSSSKVKVICQNSRSHDENSSFFGHGCTLRRDVFRLFVELFVYAKLVCATRISANYPVQSKENVHGPKNSFQMHKALSDFAEV